MARSTDETVDASAPPGKTRATLDASAAFAVGDFIATRYRLIRLIAAGGMGEVYEAEDLELGMRVAIKTLRADRVGDPDAAARLKQEILLARKVTHPNVIRLFDVGFHVLRDQRELVFFTMELLDGESLADRVRSAGRLEPVTALGLAKQMAAALDAAHDAGLIHRDFKSQNVLVSSDRAVVTDFGLAREHLDAAPTATSGFVGTPAYMAPEQITRAHPIGPAVDIYAFGVVLYEMVTGTWPFRRETALATAAARIEERAPSPRVHVPDLPAAWEAAILRCLEREPSKRFRRASDVVAALSRRPPIRWRPVLAAFVALAAIGGGILFATHRPTGCTAPSLPDIFVDAKAQPGGTGSRECPLRTISAALAIDASKRTIHVAEGFYDKAHGERFPLELRDETTLIGAGAERTTIAGVGPWDGKTPGGTLGSTWLATLVTGDVSKRIEIAQLSLVSGFTQAQSDVAGLVCTRGASQPNTFVHDVVIGPAYGKNIIVGTEEKPHATACYLDVSRARLHDGVTGVWQIGCGIGTGRIPTGLQIHDTTFEGFHNVDPAYPGAGLLVWDCLRSLLVENSTFADSDAGVVMVHHNPETLGPVAFRKNTFKLLSRYGIRFFLAVVAELRGNRFLEVAAHGDSSGRAAGLSIYSDGLSAPHLVLRDNTFEENDVGIEIEGLGGKIASMLAIDAGRADDRGNNRFICNAAPTQSTVAGGDLAIRANIGASGHVQLVGNLWDHAPPTRATQASNGLDILAPQGTQLDTADSRGDDGYCPARIR